MNVLLFRATTEMTREAIEKGAAGLAGQPVWSKPGGGHKIGVVKRAWVEDTEHGLELWADLDVQEAFLPHEMNLGRLAIERTEP